jgi:hypothetical protein
MSHLNIIKLKGAYVQKVLILLCTLSYLFIHFNDTKWTLPILAWYFIGVTVGEGPEMIIPSYVLACWLYLWYLLFRKNKVISITQLIVVFITLIINAIYVGYKQIKIFIDQNNNMEMLKLFILPFLIFLIFTILLFRNMAKHF